MKTISKNREGDRIVRNNDMEHCENSYATYYNYEDQQWKYQSLSCHCRWCICNFRVKVVENHKDEN